RVLLVAHNTNTGGVSSTTDTSAVVLALKPLVSVTVKVTRFVPTPSSVPAIGLCEISKGLQSWATICALKSGNRAAQLLSAFRVRLVAPTRITGALVSITISVMVHVLALD